MKSLPGINIQWPWSRLIIEGRKTVETRSYPLPLAYKNTEVVLIETPGAEGKLKYGIRRARIIGTIRFRSSFRYSSEELWLGDFSRHLVGANDLQFGWKVKSEKWGWEVEVIQVFSQPRPAPSSRGIIFTKKCDVDL